MKICPKCGAENKDSKIQCINCFESLSLAKNVNDVSYQQEELTPLEKLHKSKKKRKSIFIVIYLTVCVALAIVYIVKGIMVNNSFASEHAEVLLVAIPIIAISLLNLVKPMLFFKLGHFLSVRNIDDAEPTIFYVVCRTIVTYFGLTIAPIVLLICIIL